MVKNDSDQRFMAEAVRVARRAARQGEVPVGAVLVIGGRALARAGNATLKRGDPTAHAEVRVLRKGARAVGSHRLNGCTLYVTLEPCLMCLGAMTHARIARCVYGARDPKVGAFSILALPGVRRGLNHRFSIEGGVLADRCGDLLREFFRSRRGTR